MRCKKCNASVFDRPLERINEKGVNAILWCRPCIAEHEPELHKNIIEDKSQIEKDLEEICYGTDPKK